MNEITKWLIQAIFGIIIVLIFLNWINIKLAKKIDAPIGGCYIAVSEEQAITWNNNGDPNFHAQQLWYVCPNN